MYIWFKIFGLQHPVSIKIAQEIGAKNNNSNKNKRRSLNFN